MFQYHYAREKLSASVRILATEEGDIRSRLKIAFNEFQTLQLKDFPPELHEDYYWIIKELTKRKPKYQFEITDNPFDENQSNYIEWKKHGSVHYNLRRMKNRTGSQIAKRICTLHDKIQNAYENYRLNLRK